MIEITLTGRIGKDAEIKDFGNGNQVINFSVAVSDNYTKQDGTKVERTIWADCVLPVREGKTGRTQYLKKGCIVLVKGKPEARAYLKGDEPQAQLRVLNCTVENQTWPDKDGSFIASESNREAISEATGNNYPPLQGPTDDLPF